MCNWRGVGRIRGMIQMQLLVATDLPPVSFLAPVAAVAVLGLAVMRKEPTATKSPVSLGGGMIGALVAMGLVFAGRGLGVGSELGNAMVIGGAGGSVLAFAVLVVLSRLASRGGERAVGLAAAAFATLGVWLWTWLLASFGERLGVAADDWSAIGVVLLASSIGSACVALGSTDHADERVARGMQVFATVRGVIVALIAIAASTAGAMDELAAGEQRQLAARLVAGVLGVAGAGTLAAAVKRVPGVVAAVVGAAAVWMAMKDETAIPAVRVGLAVGVGAIAALVMAWRAESGWIALAVAAGAGWALLRSEDSAMPGLLGTAMAGLGFAVAAAPRVSLTGGNADGSRMGLAAAAVAGVLLVPGVLESTRLAQTEMARATGPAYPRTNYKDGSFIGKVDIGGPHGVYVGNAMLALIFPGAGPDHSTVYDAGMVDTTRLQEHVLETLRVGMVFPLSAPGAEEHGHDEHDHEGHDHAHDDGGHDHDPASARARLLEMTGEVPHGDHGHAYTQDVIASRHATLGDLLAFHGGSLGDGRFVAGVLAGLAAAVLGAGGVMRGGLRALGVVGLAAIATLGLGMGAACGMVIGVALGAAGGAWAASGARGGMSAIIAGAAVTGVLAGVVVRFGAFLG